MRSLFFASSACLPRVCVCARCVSAPVFGSAATACVAAPRIKLK